MKNKKAIKFLLERLDELTNRVETLETVLVQKEEEERREKCATKPADNFTYSWHFFDGKEWRPIEPQPSDRKQEWPAIVHYIGGIPLRVIEISDLGSSGRWVESIDGQHFYVHEWSCKIKEDREDKHDLP